MKMDLMDQIIAFESGELDAGQTVAMFQGLVDSGLAWKLQGFYGRTAMDLIKSGEITAKVSQ
jgi:hypothetical protein